MRNNIQRISQYRVKPHSPHGRLLPMNPPPGQRRIHHKCTAGQSIGQSRQWVLLHVSHMLYPAVNMWRILGDGGGNPTRGGCRHYYYSDIFSVYSYFSSQFPSTFHAISCYQGQKCEGFGGFGSIILIYMVCYLVRGILSYQNCWYYFLWMYCQHLPKVPYGAIT